MYLHKIILISNLNNLNLKIIIIKLLSALPEEMGITEG